MIDRAVEKTIGWLLLIGAPLTTLFLITETVTDPVNATKLFVAGGVGFALIAVTLIFNPRHLWAQYKAFILTVLAFNLAGLNAVLRSDSPLTQNLYGAYGRNTGFITYLILGLISIGTLGLRDKESFRKIVLGIQIAGLVNVIYCAWVLAFGDFIGWSNPYGNILGLFGNPDFISAFLGIFNATVFAVSLTPKTPFIRRALAGILILVSFFEILKSHAIQGVVVTLGGFVIVGFFWIRSKFQQKSVSMAYAILAGATGILGIFGALQKGPFAFVYKTSVSLRGAYWNAGLVMGMDHPLSGVGMDGYGDWYRRARSLNAATVLPGPSTITNAAHNVVIDIFAYGGFPLLVSYLLILVFVAIASLRVIRRSMAYDPIFVAMFSAWACYEVQSIISINQIGLAIWGWVLGGSLIAYEYVTRPEHESQDRVIPGRSRKVATVKSIVSPQLVAGIGIVVGFLVAVPPLSADSKWRSALKSADAQRVMNALVPSYMNPQDSSRYSQAVQLFITNNLPDQAHEIALKASKFNPNYFDAWRIIYFIQPTTAREKALALQNMKRLDPLNPDVTAQP